MRRYGQNFTAEYQEFEKFRDSKQKKCSLLKEKLTFFTTVQNLENTVVCTPIAKQRLALHLSVS
jgi:hypothetical protein